MKIEIWNDIFDKYDILENIKKNGKYEISSQKINEFRQARLMTKFDNASQLPNIFLKNKLSILPITRGSYVIAPMDIFFEFPHIDYSSEICYLSFPEHIQSLCPDNITSEALSLNCAYISGILSDFIGEEEIFPTISGRMSSSNFSFGINNKITDNQIHLTVNNAQIEIDGSYESPEYLSIIEAKNYLAEDFVIRQLYYPMRLLTNRITKKIKTIFMVYTNNMFYLYEYKFNDIQNYNSLTLKRLKRYSFEKIYITLDDIEKILLSTKIIKEPQIPFPQADSFERVINLCELLYKSDLSKTHITINYGFHQRQTDYYINAGIYLNLIKEENSLISLTETGKEILEKSSTRRQLDFVGKILEHAVFKDVLTSQLKTGNTLSKKEIIDIMKKYPLYHVKEESTFYRRASTVSSWVNWIISLINA